MNQRTGWFKLKQIRGCYIPWIFPPTIRACYFHSWCFLRLHQPRILLRLRLIHLNKFASGFLNALNGSDSGFSDTSSVNYLLGLDDEISLREKKDVNQKGAIATNLRGNNSGQDVHSIPDSPMMFISKSGFDWCEHFGSLILFMVKIWTWMNRE